MKITSRTIVKALRLYKLADDNTSVRSLRNINIFNEGEYLRASWIYENIRYGLVFGSTLDEDDISQVWPDWPESAVILRNPLDDSQTLTPFKGKYLAIFNVPSVKIRLDNYLATVFDKSISRSLWQKYIKLGCVKVNDIVQKTSSKEISDTDLVSASFPSIDTDMTEVPIIYQDNDVIVVNKPSGVLTHAKGGISNEMTLADFFRSHSDFALSSDRPGVVHRLDRDTSGVIIGARHEQAAKHLQKQFADRKVGKVYLAIIDGIPQPLQAKIDLPISRNPKKPSTFRVDSNGNPSQTIYRVMHTNNKQSLVELKPITGRTHQLRVHMGYLKTPIKGDRVYGKAGDRLLLHAYQITISLPSGVEMTFTAPIPEIFKQEFPDLNL